MAEISAFPKGSFPTYSWPDLTWPLAIVVTLFTHAEFWDGSVVMNFAVNNSAAMNMAVSEGVVMNRSITGTYSELQEL